MYVSYYLTVKLITNSSFSVILQYFEFYRIASLILDRYLSCEDNEGEGFNTRLSHRNITIYHVIKVEGKNNI